MDAAGNEDVTTSLNEIRRAGHRAKDLVQRILSFSRRSPPSRKVVDIADLVNEAVTLLRATAPKSIAIDVHIDPKTPMVYVDPSQLHQVILNLCTNAVHAISDLNYGLLRISVSTCAALAGKATGPGEMLLVTDPEDWSEENVCVCVQDNGCGMDDLPPITRTSHSSKKSINPENDGHENKQIQRRENHWLSAPSRSGHADQGDRPQTRLQ